jgi:hypothetical protein
MLIVVEEEEDNRTAGRKRTVAGVVASDSMQTASNAQGRDYQEE